MDINLFHALVGRFSILLPLLVLFFELSFLISNKYFIRTFTHYLLLVSMALILLSILSGIHQFYFYRENLLSFQIHFYLSFGVFVLFFISGVLRFLSFKLEKEIFFVFYMILFTAACILNLFNNEYIVYVIRGS